MKFPDNIDTLVPPSTHYAAIQQLLAKQEDNTRFDVIVVGVGSMGAAACYHVAKQGHRVLGLEQFDLVHELGSHAGQSRIIRKAYFEHPNYVPLLERAYTNWRTLEEEWGSPLYFQNGLAYFGPRDHPLITGTLDSASKYQLDVFRDREARSFTQFNVPSDYACLLEPDAGFVTPERAILAFVEQSLKYGACIRTHEKVTEWKHHDGVIEVKTGKQTYQCKKLIIAAGPWTNTVVDISNINVTRQVIAWAKPKISRFFEMHDFPCWAYAHPDFSGFFYGFPMLPTNSFGGPSGLKFAHHTSGVTTDPDRVNRQVSEQEQLRLVEAVKGILPDGIDRIETFKTCLYTYSEDEDFVVDFYQDNSDVIVATGFSGHGFKFASVIGEILSDLALKGSTSHPIEFLRANRF